MNGNDQKKCSWVSKESWDRAYKNPKWFLKYKEILERDGNKCTVCSSFKHLQIHHTYYYYEYTTPWEYPDDCYLTLCREHHHWWHEHFELIYKDKLKPPKKHKHKTKAQKLPWVRKSKAKTLARKVEEREVEKKRKKEYKFVNGRWWKL